MMRMKRRNLESEMSALAGRMSHVEGRVSYMEQTIAKPMTDPGNIDRVREMRKRAEDRINSRNMVQISPPEPTDQLDAADRIRAFIARHEGNVSDQYIRGLRAALILVENRDWNGEPRAATDGFVSLQDVASVAQEIIGNEGPRMVSSVWASSLLVDLLEGKR